VSPVDVDVFGSVRKPSLRRGAWALFRGVCTYDGNVIEFQSFSMNKNPLHVKLPRLVLAVSCTCNCFDSMWVRNQ